MKRGRVWKLDTQTFMGIAIEAATRLGNSPCSPFLIDLALDAPREGALMGKVGNGRWARQTIRDILIEHKDTLMPPSDNISTTHGLSNLTFLLQKSQTALYSTWRQILHQQDLLSA